MIGHFSLSDACIYFARTGNPNRTKLPLWAPFSLEPLPTMIFDNHTQRINSPERDEQRSISRR
jgi:carboxylesterase type B